MKSFCVVTTINPPTRAVRVLDPLFPQRLLVVGDRKTPAAWNHGESEFLSFDYQNALPFASAACARVNHYSRKNLGYLVAISRGAEVIYDTDDDNIPNDAWRLRSETCEAEIAAEPGWCNTYEFFTDARIWPRGFPLQHLSQPAIQTQPTAQVRCPIQQGLADGEPDVDAIWRLVMPQSVSFTRRRSVALAAGTWCPFNTQSTWFWPAAFPLLYVPVTAPFRMCDIWRSFVAQRCLWAAGLGSVAFHSPGEVVQERNPHNLLRDFEDEVSGYLHNAKIVRLLENTTLSRDVLADLRMCYRALVSAGYLVEAEMTSVDAWIEDLRKWKY